MLSLKNIMFYFTLLITVVNFIDGKRLFGSQRKSSRQPSAVTKSTYTPNNNAHSNSYQETYNPSQNSPNIGWNVPKQGGGHVQSPPVHSMNNAPNNFNYAGSNYGQTSGIQHPQYNYGNLPPAYGNYHSPAGGLPPGHYYASQGNLPAGATYIPAGGALPPGATYYSSPPQQSSGLGFGSGLAAGALGGAILGHVLTPTNTKVIEQAPSTSNDPNTSGDRITIINLQPSINATQTNTSITTENQNATVPLTPLETSILESNATNANVSEQVQVPPAPGSIICVPIRVLEADPKDPATQIEVEKIACYPAPQVTENGPNSNATAVGAETSPVMQKDNNNNLQSLQQSPNSNTLLPEQSPIRDAPSQASSSLYKYCNVIFTSVLMYVLAYTFN